MDYNVPTAETKIPLLGKIKTDDPNISASESLEPVQNSSKL